MPLIVLSPNTNRLRQLVRDHGEVWCDLTSESFKSAFSGAKLHVMSLDGSHVRNVPSDICETLKVEVSP